jgi:aryl-alcohol dehydrogenase-like predicted oxidoreductase
MQRRLLGNTGLKVGAVGVGCMTFGWRAPAAEVSAIVSSALDVGINLFDTSVSYGRGTSETLLGDALQRSGRRNDALIATKFGGAARADTTRDELGNGRRNLMAQCELSLQRLKTDRIDLLQIHHYDPEVPLEETLGGLDELVRQGKVRYIGCSNFIGGQLEDALQCADRRKFCSVASHQARFNLLDRRAEVDVMSIARRHGVANLTYSPLAEGLLTGKYRAGEAFPEGSRFAAASPANNYDLRLTARVDRAITSLAALALSSSMSLWQFALTWVLSNPAVCCALLGPSNRGQIQALSALREFQISEELGELVNSVNPPGGCVLSNLDPPFRL